MNVKIRNKFIEIKYSISNGFVIFITYIYEAFRAYGSVRSAEGKF